jgi:hypothetical protein
MLLPNHIGSAMLTGKDGIARAGRSRLVTGSGLLV